MSAETSASVMLDRAALALHDAVGLLYSEGRAHLAADAGRLLADLHAFIATERMTP